jgi:tight adherence protein B
MSATLVIPTLGGLTVVACLYAIYGWLAVRAAARRAIRHRLDPELPARGAADPATDILRHETFSDIPRINRLLETFSPATRLREQLMQAGISVRVASVFYVMGIAALAVALYLDIRHQVPPPAALALGALASVCTTLGCLRYRRRSRLRLFVAQLPAALDMIKSSIQAGHTLHYAMEVALDELDEPLAGGFRSVLSEIRLGLSPREALENLYRRVPVPEMRFFVLAVALTREVGGNLSEVLGTLATTLRDRMKLRQQIKALSAQGRASAALLFMIPPTVALLANLVRPGFVTPLFEHPTGRLLLCVAVGFQLAGFLLARRIVNPKELGLA